MSVIARWETHRVDSCQIDTGNMTNSEFLAALAFVFVSREILGPSDLPMMRAMAAANPVFKQLVEALENHGEIRVWGEQ